MRAKIRYTQSIGWPLQPVMSRLCNSLPCLKKLCHSHRKIKIILFSFTQFKRNQSGIFWGFTVQLYVGCNTCKKWTWLKDSIVYFELTQISWINMDKPACSSNLLSIQIWYFIQMHRISLLKWWVQMKRNLSVSASVQS